MDAGHATHVTVPDKWRQAILHASQVRLLECAFFDVIWFNESRGGRGRHYGSRRNRRDQPGHGLRLRILSGGCLAKYAEKESNKGDLITIHGLTATPSQTQSTKSDKHRSTIFSSRRVGEEDQRSGRG